MALIPAICTVAFQSPCLSTGTPGQLAHVSAATIGSLCTISVAISLSEQTFLIVAALKSQTPISNPCGLARRKRQTPGTTKDGKSTQRRNKLRITS